MTLTGREVWLCVALSAAVIIIFTLFYNKIFAVTFDEDFSRAAGTKAESYNLLIAIVIAVIIVLAMNLVGSLLITALAMVKLPYTCSSIFHCCFFINSNIAMIGFFYFIYSIKHCLHGLHSSCFTCFDLCRQFYSGIIQNTHIYYLHIKM